MSFDFNIRSRSRWPRLVLLAAVFLLSPLFAEAQPKHNRQRKPRPQPFRAKFLENHARTVHLDIRGDGCTGVIVETNLILTNYHCVDKPLTYNGVTAQVVRKDEANDLALLAARTERFEPLIIALPRTAQKVYTFGHAEPHRKSLAYGRTFKVRADVLESSVKIYGGQSGSGLFNKRDELVAVLNQHYLNDLHAVGINARHVECLWRPTVKCDLAKAAAKK